MFSEPESVVDLTNPIDYDTPVWPTYPPVDIERTSLAPRDGANIEHVSMRSHTATHVDAPLHFVEGGETVGDLPIETFMGSGVVLDLAPKDPGDAVTVEDLEPFAGEVAPDDVVMLHTGWDDHYGQSTEYLFEFPYLTGEASQYLADLDPKAVGIDTMSVGGWVEEAPAHGPTTDVSPAESHVPLLEEGIVVVEELRNLDRVLDGEASKRAYFLYPPLRMVPTGGAPVRAFAFL